MRVFAISALVLGFSFFLAPEPAESQTFSALLSGDQEVPPVDTRFRSFALFRFLFNDSLLFGYRLNFFPPQEVTAVHIHEAPVGVGGPIVLTLRPDAVCIDITPFLTIYYATAAQLRGGLEGKTLSDLRALMQTGGTYLNLHTPEHPGGEIRGQFAPLGRLGNMEPVHTELANLREGR